ncbi:D-3-phosphoglycerate dehydrogenase [Rhizobium subbaraonis]|uniref:D-3-phosphoglycerate dehydrogenase n=1 Tax=Rhizobium subbaraonis TaxID=908946 RepID=A0A285UV93_9HYPH|nr:hydroxyacid dehydrogenase [Rhizobium subbaraonis]SOC45298.1 D-3-phosphoglycerate dehydrogenase [Rhizobium subbaraonis]
MSYTIFITAPSLHADGVAILENAGCRLIYLEKGGDEAAVDRIMGENPVDAVISRTVNLSGKAIANCQTLKVVSKHGVGVSNIDVAAATARNIPVFVTPGANAQSVAEMALGLLLASARRIAWMDQEIKSGRWSRAQDGVELQGRTLALVGFGQIGQRLAWACLALGMKVVAYDPGFSLKSPIEGVPMMSSLDELLPLSDVLSLHIPLTAQTRGLIGRDAFPKLPDDAILINTARGEVVDEAALIDALREGKLYAAGLDTTAEEPIAPGNPLLALSNVVLTPHVGGSTPAALAAMARGAADNVLGFLSGARPPQSACVNPATMQSIKE